jgi:hypothetical protein
MARRKELITLRSYVEIHPRFGGTHCLHVQVRNLKSIKVALKSSVPASQETYCAFITKINQLILLSEMIAVYFEIHKGYTNTLCGYFNIKAWGALNC